MKIFVKWIFELCYSTQKREFCRSFLPIELLMKDIDLSDIFENDKDLLYGRLTDIAFILC